MSYLTRTHKQTITRWTGKTHDGYGSYTFSTLSTIKGRWEEHEELYRDDKGDEYISRAKVFVSVDLVEGDYLFLGTSEETDPTSLTGAWPVRRYNKTPNTKGTKFERVAVLG